MNKLSAIGDWTSILGLVATLGGFWIAIFNIRSSRKASEEARNAVESVRKDLLKIDTIADLSKAIAILDEIKRIYLNQNMNPFQLMERYEELCKLTIIIKESNNNLQDDYKEYLQNALVHLRGQQVTIGKNITTPTKIPVSRINPILSEISDKYTLTLAILKDKDGRLVHDKSKILRANKNTG